MEKGQVRIGKVTVSLEAYVDEGKPFLRPIQTQPVVYAPEDFEANFQLDKIVGVLQDQYDRENAG